MILELCLLVKKKKKAMLLVYRLYIFKIIIVNAMPNQCLTSNMLSNFKHMLEVFTVNLSTK